MYIVKVFIDLSPIFSGLGTDLVMACLSVIRSGLRKDNNGIKKMQGFKKA